MMKEIQLNRQLAEILACIVIVVLGLSVLLVPIKRQGSLTYADGKITYAGTIVNDRMNGQGKLTFENGDVYEGNFINGVFNGKGKFVAATGWSYEGNFKAGQPDGQGTLIAKDKKVYKGTFKQGIYQK